MNIASNIASAMSVDNSDGDLFSQRSRASGSEARDCQTCRRFLGCAAAFCAFSVVSRASSRRMITATVLLRLSLRTSRDFALRASVFSRVFVEGGIGDGLLDLFLAP